MVVLVEVDTDEDHLEADIAVDRLEVLEDTVEEVVEVLVEDTREEVLLLEKEDIAEVLVVDIEEALRVVEAVDTETDGEDIGKREEAARHVVSAYVVDAEMTADGPRPAHIKERIRGLGPTVRPDLTLKPEAGDLTAWVI